MYVYLSTLGGVKSACKDRSFAQNLVNFANQMWQLPEWPFQTLTYMFYNLPPQIIEGALQYKIAPLTPPNVDRYTYMHIRPLPTFYDNLWNSHMGWSCHSYPKTRLLTRMYACIFSKTGYIYNFWHTSLLDRMSVYLALQGGSG